MGNAPHRWQAIRGQLDRHSLERLRGVARLFELDGRIAVEGVLAAEPVECQRLGEMVLHRDAHAVAQHVNPLDRERMRLGRKQLDRLDFDQPRGHARIDPQTGEPSGHVEPSGVFVPAAVVR